MTDNYRDDSETNFTSMINPERPFGASENDNEQASTSFDVHAEIEKKTADMRLGKQEVCPALK